MSTRYKSKKALRSERMARPLVWLELLQSFRDCSGSGTRPGLPPDQAGSCPAEIGVLIIGKRIFERIWGPLDIQMVFIFIRGI